MKTHTLCKYICNRVNPLILLIGVLTIFALTACEEKAANTFTDSRDGKTYKTVKIGEQVWMAENLNYEAKGSLCYDNKPENCAKYGRLYDWNTANSVCPSGWHLPSGNEWQTLVDFAGGDEVAGKKLKATEGAFGFSALPGGRGYSDGDFGNIGSYCYWWSSLEYDSDDAYLRSILYYDGETYYNYGSKSDLFSVRCVRN